MAWRKRFGEPGFPSCVDLSGCFLVRCIRGRDYVIMNNLSPFIGVKLRLCLCVYQVVVAQKVTAGVYKGVTTSEIDELAAETAASMTSTHPHYAIVSN